LRAANRHKKYKTEACLHPDTLVKVYEPNDIEQVSLKRLKDLCVTVYDDNGNVIGGDRVLGINNQICAVHSVGKIKSAVSSAAALSHPHNMFVIQPMNAGFRKYFVTRNHVLVLTAVNVNPVIEIDSLRIVSVVVYCKSYRPVEQQLNQFDIMNEIPLVNVHKCDEDCFGVHEMNLFFAESESALQFCKSNSTDSFNRTIEVQQYNSFERFHCDLVHQDSIIQLSVHQFLSSCSMKLMHRCLHLFKVPADQHSDGSKVETMITSSFEILSLSDEMIEKSNDFCCDVSFMQKSCGEVMNSKFVESFTTLCAIPLSSSVSTFIAVSVEGSILIAADNQVLSNCKNFQRDGECPYGPRCRFIHNTLTQDQDVLPGLGSVHRQ